MAQLDVEKIGKVLEEKGIDTATIATVKSTIVQNIPPQTMDKAILFLGGATVILAVGSILLAGLGNDVPEALWGSLGAGIGGLAGVFMGKN